MLAPSASRNDNGRIMSANLANSEQWSHTPSPGSSNDPFSTRSSGVPFYLGSSIYFSRIRSAPPEMTTSITKDASEKLMITTTKKKVPFA